MPSSKCVSRKTEYSRQSGRKHKLAWHVGTLAHYHITHNRIKKAKPLALKSIKLDKRRLADEVYKQLFESIANGDIGPDDRLVQEKLATELDISRTPVREALLRLEQEGVLVTAKRGGFKLHRMTESEVRQLYQARAAIEGQAARILASKNNRSVNQQIRQAILQQEKNVEPTVKSYFDANRNIHRTFGELISNQYLLDMFDNIWNRAVSYQLFSTIDNIDLSQSLGDHMVLLDAIETGDKTVALETYIEHVTDGFNLQITALGLDGKD